MKSYDLGASAARFIYAMLRAQKLSDIFGQYTSPHKKRAAFSCDPLIYSMKSDLSLDAFAMLGAIKTGLFIAIADVQRSKDGNNLQQDEGNNHAECSNRYTCCKVCRKQFVTAIE